jgi:hypothetical protein
METTIECHSIYRKFDGSYYYILGIKKMGDNTIDILYVDLHKPFSQPFSTSKDYFLRIIIERNEQLQMTLSYPRFKFIRKAFNHESEFIKKKLDKSLINLFFN